jgi:hypothetical protein
MTGTGYPACDAFIDTATECINTKLPPPERANAQGQLDAFRGALRFISGDQAAKACQKALERVQ